MLSDPSKLSDCEVVEDVERRLQRMLSKLTHYPVLVDEVGATKTLKALALAGWDVHDESCGAVQHLICSLCLRSAAVQSFDHRALPSERAADDAADEQEKPSKAPRLAAAIPPVDGLWTPQASAVASGERQADAAHCFDQYACHRFFCPMYRRAGDDLSPHALRVLRVYEEAQRRVQADPAATKSFGAITSSNLGAQGDLESTMARAEELLRSLSKLLPVASGGRSL